MSPKVGLVVPTLGDRPKFLVQCLESIRAAGSVYVLVVAPASFHATELTKSGLIDEVLLDNGTGLPQAINLGVAALPEGIEYVNWLGDDDLLIPDSLVETAAVLVRNPRSPMVYGACDYIDEKGNIILKNQSGSWAVPLLRFGPDLVPQPGALFRRSAFNFVGGLSTEYSLAFDLDLLIRISKIGKPMFINKTLAKFRWHPESLSVAQRNKSVQEASRVRLAHLPSFLRPISFLWEPPVRFATLVAGKRVSALAKKKAMK